MMMRFLTSCLVVGCFASGAQAKAKFLHVVAKVPFNTPDDATIYLTGNLRELCSWTPQCLEMHVIGQRTYEVRVALADSVTAFEFKVTRGSWSTDAVSERDGHSLPNFKVNLDSNADTYVVNLSAWRDLVPGAPNEQVTIYKDFSSPELGNKRDIRVWLPADYDQTPERKYPVIYMHDGQNLFDANTCACQAEWSIDENMNTLIRKHQIQEAIVIGVDTNGDRFSEYDFMQRGELYGQFLTHTLKPWVDAKFRTLSDRGHTYLMGSSMGALISLSLVWHFPEYFSKAAGLSLPAWIHSNVIYQIITAQTKPTLPFEFYIDHGDAGADVGYEQPVRDFLEHLSRLGVQPSQINYQIFPYADHWEADWARRVEIPLKWMLGVAL